MTLLLKDLRKGRLQVSLTIPELEVTLSVKTRDRAPNNPHLQTKSHAIGLSSATKKLRSNQTIVSPAETITIQYTPFLPFSLSTDASAEKSQTGARSQETKSYGSSRRWHVLQVFYLPSWQHLGILNQKVVDPMKHVLWNADPDSPTPKGQGAARWSPLFRNDGMLTHPSQIGQKLGHPVNLLFVKISTARDWLVNPLPSCACGAKAACMHLVAEQQLVKGHPLCWCLAVVHILEPSLYMWHFLDSKVAGHTVIREVHDVQKAWVPSHWFNGLSTQGLQFWWLYCRVQCALSHFYHGCMQFATGRQCRELRCNQWMPMGPNGSRQGLASLTGTCVCLLVTCYCPLIYWGILDSRVKVSFNLEYGLNMVSASGYVKTDVLAVPKGLHPCGFASGSGVRTAVLSRN